MNQTILALLLLTPLTTLHAADATSAIREDCLKRRLEVVNGDFSDLRVNINCWNEWTESSYLEPDTVHGLKYLEAVRAVFDPAPPAK